MNRHYIYKGICAAVIMTSLAACQSDDTLGDPQQGAAKVEFVVPGISANTRVTYSDYISSAFEVGDEVGGFVISKTVTDTETTYDYMNGFTKNARYRVSSGSYSYNGVEYPNTLTPEITSDIFPVEQRYIFYYPYKEGAEMTNFTHTVLANQNSAGAFESSDLLRARVNGADNNDNVPSSVLENDENGNQYLGVNMAHVMTSIVLKVEKSLLVDDQKATAGDAILKNVYRTVSGIDLTRAMKSEVQQSADYKYSTGETVDKTDITMWQFSEVNESGTDYVIYRAVMPGQKVVANGTVEFFTLTFANNTATGEERTYKLNISSALLDATQYDFQPTYYYLFTLTKNDGLRFCGIIKNLEDGGDYYYEY